ncbi:hypothetical protein ACTWPT_13465 [Nonomuraea sp. 3N208]|uniref:hypothetical protein n=1 Tax=Nonomuraea sp. 3N208 TaxID=3457421 RepID=UPI003FCEBD03
MARCGCGGASRCTCLVTAGTGVTVAGDGSSANPYVISSGGGGAVTCDQAGPCLSAGPGVAYDPANQLSCGPAGLLVPGASAVSTACGLSGDGSAGAPLTVAVQAWPYPCDVTTEAGGVYCDANGVLRAEPRGYVVSSNSPTNNQSPAPCRSS